MFNSEYFPHNHNHNAKLAKMSNPTPKIYVVEHLDTELEEWSSREYASIAKESQASGSKFYLTSVPEELVLPERLQGLVGLTVEHKSVEELYKEEDAQGGFVPSKRVCLLDPAAKEELRPSDGEEFDVFLFGGILGMFLEFGREKVLI